MNKLGKLFQSSAIWGYSQIDWVNLRRFFERVEIKAFSFTYPILGQYIVISDSFFFPSARAETYFLYFGLLVISISGLLFLAICPFIYRAYGNLSDFTSNFKDTQDNRDRLNALLRAEFDFDVGGWEKSLTIIWADQSKMSSWLNGSFKTLLMISIILLILSSLISIARVTTSLF